MEDVPKGLQTTGRGKQSATPVRRYDRTSAAPSGLWPFCSSIAGVVPLPVVLLPLRGVLIPTTDKQADAIINLPPMKDVPKGLQTTGRGKRSAAPVRRYDRTFSTRRGFQHLLAYRLSNLHALLDSPQQYATIPPFMNRQREGLLFITDSDTA